MGSRATGGTEPHLGQELDLFCFGEAGHGQRAGEAQYLAEGEVSASGDDLGTAGRTYSEKLAPIPPSQRRVLGFGRISRYRQMIRVQIPHIDLPITVGKGHGLVGR